MFVKGFRLPSDNCNAKSMLSCKDAALLVEADWQLCSVIPTMLHV